MVAQPLKYSEKVAVSFSRVQSVNENGEETTEKLPVHKKIIDTEHEAF